MPRGPESQAGVRRKGHDFERSVATAFRSIYPGAKRCAQAHHRQSKSHGESVPDVEAGPFDIECKVGKNPPVRPAYEQAVRDSRPGQIPIAIVRKNGSNQNTRPNTSVFIGYGDLAKITRPVFFAEVESHPLEIEYRNFLSLVTDAGLPDTANTG